MLPPAVPVVGASAVHQTRSSPPVSSPSNNASVRAQKRRRAATETETETQTQTQFIDFSHVSKKRRADVDRPSARPRRFAYSPLPPSSPVRTERSSSEEPAPDVRVLSTVAERSREHIVQESDDDWLNSIGRSEAVVDDIGNTHASTHASTHAHANASIGASSAPAPPAPAPAHDPAPAQFEAEDEDEPLTPESKRRAAEKMLEFWEKYWPVYIPPPSSMDIKMEWSPLPDKDADKDADKGADKGEDADKDKNAGSSSSPVANVGGGAAQGWEGFEPQPQAGPSTGFGESVSGALMRAKSKGKGKGKAAEPAGVAYSVSPGAGAPLAWRQYTREEEKMLWPEYNSNLLS